MSNQRTELRSLNEFERELLNQLLSVDFPGRDQLREQIHNCAVREIDEHGCLEFDVRTGLPAPVTQRVPVEAEARDSDGALIGALLFVRSGKIYGLEFNRWDGGQIIQMSAVNQWEVTIRPS